MANLVTFDVHVKTCEACRQSEYARGAAARGLVRFTRETAARRAVAWRALCLEGKQIFVESWRALGLGLPEYVQETA